MREGRMAKVEDCHGLINRIRKSHCCQLIAMELADPDLAITQMHGVKRGIMRRKALLENTIGVKDYRVLELPNWQRRKTQKWRLLS